MAVRVRRTYVALAFGNTLAASLIWGINTLFLLDAGLSNVEAFSANAFFTLGMVVFEIPTGVVADHAGRRVSYLLGTITLAASTLAYFWLWTWHAPFAWWAVASVLLGLGYTFFSGATDAWLVDALAFAGAGEDLAAVFGRAQAAAGAAMLIGSLGGGLLAQATSLGAPFVLRALILAGLFGYAFAVMRDVGFTPDRTRTASAALREIVAVSLREGLGHPPVRWLMLASVFTSPVGFYVFYALQPYLLGLFGRRDAYWVAGLAAALSAATQIVGGLASGRLARLAPRRTTALIAAVIVSSALLIVLWLTTSFALALVVVAASGFAAAASGPIRQSYLNGMISSSQRATVLSFDSLLGNTGGIVVQPALGRAADVWSYGTSFAIGAIVQLAAVPLLIASRARRHPADRPQAAELPRPAE